MDGYKLLRKGKDGEQGCQNMKKFGCRELSGEMTTVWLRAHR